MTGRTVDIRIKRVYDPPNKVDGTRVLVDRLWPRGLRKEKGMLMLWLKEIAPSPELRESFGHDPACWAEFGHRYRAELARNDGAVAQLANLSKLGPMPVSESLLCGEKDGIGSSPDASRSITLSQCRSPNRGAV
jgi:uncharacterized protein YeaO (DUF488 family)